MMSAVDAGPPDDAISGGRDAAAIVAVGADDGGLAATGGGAAVTEMSPLEDGGGDDAGAATAVTTGAACGKLDETGFRAVFHSRPPQGQSPPDRPRNSISDRVPRPARNMAAARSSRQRPKGRKAPPA